MRYLENIFEKIIAPENLWQAWRLFRRGKQKRAEVREFERKLDDNLLDIARDFANRTYHHQSYRTFIVFDPKRRVISAPRVRDQIVHRAVWNILYPFYDRAFIAHAFSCREGKGISRAIKLAAHFLRSMTQNGKEKCFVLHGDVEKFFDSVDHQTLASLLARRLRCEKTIWLLGEIIESYTSGRHYPNDAPNARRGIPLGNLTSQLFCNIILHELDIFIKEQMRVRAYVRYADDFLIFARSEESLEQMRGAIKEFLWQKLRLAMNKNTCIRKASQGFDAFGIRFFPIYAVARPKTARHMLLCAALRGKQYERRGLTPWSWNQTFESYRGLLANGQNYYLREKLCNFALIYA